MSFTGRTQELAFADLQRAAIPYLHRMAYEGGAGANLDDKGEWRIIHHKKGGKVWQLGRQRDMFGFQPLAYSKVHVESGPAVPTGEMKNVYAITQNISTPFPSTVVLHPEYEKGEELTLVEEDTKTLGASITTFVEGQVGGGETSGGSYVKAGVSATVSGEIAKMLSKGKNSSELVGLKADVEIPAGVTGLIQQLIQSGPVKVELTQRNVVDLGWFYVDYKKMYGGRHGFLHGNKEDRSWNGKSRVNWRVDDMNDFEAQCAGRHEEYPNARNMLSNRRIREAYEYLTDEDNRTIEVVSICIFEKTVHGDLSFHPERE